MRLLLACLLTSALAAQDQPPGTRAATADDWRPVVKVDPTQAPMAIVAAGYAVTVHGLFAQTTASYTFRNPNGRPLEGELEFPLPDGATVCGYALDIAGRMVDGVVVPKDQGRMILEAEQHQRRDPGLAETVRGNVFRTRIFPLPARGERTVAITWIAALTIHGSEAAARVPLPHTTLPVLHLRLAISCGAITPILGGFGNLALTDWHDEHVATADFTAVTPGDDLYIRLPDLPYQEVMTESCHGEDFVAIATLPGLTITSPTGESAAPARVALAWDASGRRSAAGIARSRAALAALLARWPRTAVDIVVFRDVPEAPVACADARALDAVLDQVVYDGCASLSHLDLRHAALPNRTDDRWLMVSDGLGMLGETLPACGDVPVTCLSPETEGDGPALRLIAARCGGLVLDLGALDPTQVAQRIIQCDRLLRVDDPAGALADVQIGSDQDRFQIMARLVGDGEVTLVFGDQCGGGGAVRVPVHRAEAIPGDTISRAWAGALASNLTIDPIGNHERILALGRQYGVVTPGTSLLVLETLDQYVRYQVEPPASQPQLRQDYLAQSTTRAQWFQDGERSQLDQLADRWAERTAWWSGAFPTPGTGPGIAATAAGTIPGRELGQAPSLQAPTAAPARAPAAGAPDGTAHADESAGEGSAAAGAADAVNAMAGSRSGGEEVSLPGSIAITPFQPTTPYLTHIAAATDIGQAYTVYLAERTTLHDSPSFFLDCASYFLPRDAALGHRILSNLAGMRLADPALLRIDAWRLQQCGDLDGAIAILRTVLELRPEEPHSYRDLALVLGMRGEERARASDVEEAMALFGRVCRRDPIRKAELGDSAALETAWNRTPDIDLIALEELNRLVARAQRGGFDRTVVIPPLDPRLQGTLDCDMRVVMSWDRDDTDIDLHVIDPAGEEAFYGHRATACGGLVSLDNTVGYGPEEFVLRHGPTGNYQISCVYYGSGTTELFGPATVVATVYLDWGRPTERHQVMTLRLDQVNQTVAVGSIAITAGPTTALARGTAQSGVVSTAQLQGLHLGQSRSEVEALLGPPQRVESGGVAVLVYHLVGSATVRIGMGPQLIWVKEEAKGMEYDLIH